MASRNSRMGVIRAIFFGFLGFIAPRLAVELGVPLDQWIATFAAWILSSPGILSRDQAIWGAMIGIGMVGLTVELWLKPAGNLFAYLKRSQAKKGSPSAKPGSGPVPSLVLLRDGHDWFLEIHNFGVDAAYTVKLDLDAAGAFGKPKVPVFGEWSDGGAADNRIIQAGSRDRVFVFGSDLHSGLILFTPKFRYVLNNKPVQLQAYSWSPSSVPPVPPQSGRIRIILSANPAFNGGSRVIEVEYKGVDLRLISGEAEMQG